MKPRVKLPARPVTPVRPARRRGERRLAKGTLTSSTAAFEQAATRTAAKLVLRLYVAGTSARSVRAIQNAKQICDEDLAGHCELEVIDIFQQPTLARDDQILAVPTLIKKLPLPLRRFIGDLSERDVILVGLDLKTRKP